MLLVSDVHGALQPLRRLVASSETLVILGDLVNLTDYRSGEGAIADALGVEFARSSARARADGDYTEMRALWAEQVGDKGDEVRRSIGDALRAQYDEVAEALEGGHGYVIHGNVDRPGTLEAVLPDSYRYAHGETLEIEGLLVGFAGGGVSTPIQAEGEVSDGEMSAMLDRMGRVDVLCSHVPPAIRPLRYDVITGREERGSDPILEYVTEMQPKYHFYGDIHQAQAATWRIGKTRCFNAGYFRATGRYLRLQDGEVKVGRLG